jgi:hypothetical protein
MNTSMRATSARRRAYVQRILQNYSLEDIYSEERSSQWIAFSHEDQQKITESQAFIGFVKASGLSPDPFDHENEDPPRPDIRLMVSGEPYYFELGEIVDQGLARAFADSIETGENTGGPFSQSEPFMSMLRQKCARAYTTEDAPVDLLLHYSTQHPHESGFNECVKAYEAEITALIAKSQFARIWIYSDCRPQKILWKMVR